MASWAQGAYRIETSRAAQYPGRCHGRVFIVRSGNPIRALSHINVMPVGDCDEAELQFLQRTKAWFLAFGDP
jgi:hypothetical protein